MQRRPTDTKEATPAAFPLGHEEWAALPGLGVPAVLVRIDTGARTSALHASDIEIVPAAPGGRERGQRVRFTLHPQTDNCGPTDGFRVQRPLAEFTCESPAGCRSRRGKTFARHGRASGLMRSRG